MTKYLATFMDKSTKERFEYAVNADNLFSANLSAEKIAKNKDWIHVETNQIIRNRDTEVRPVDFTREPVSFDINI